MPELTVRRAVTGDLAEVAPLFDAYRQFFAKRSDLSESRAFLRERMERGDSVIFVSHSAEHICGFVQLYPLFSSWYARRIWFVSDLFVAPAARGCGHAKRLVCAAQDFAGETSASSMMVEIPHSEPHLVHFYESLGFAKDSLFDLYRYTGYGTT